jgi:hypothetical protein
MSDLFKQGIRHQDLWLWDAWSVHRNDVINLFALSVPRVDDDGHSIRPEQRNDYQFTIIRFESLDRGISWLEVGRHRQPDADCAYQSANVWSGSVADLNGSLVEAFTGIKTDSPERPFIQSIYLAGLDDDFESQSSICLVSSERDYEQIVEAGYFLQPKEELGSVKGEEGGCITAWRDPFIFNASGKTLMVFAAKSAEGEPAMGLMEVIGDLPDVHARLCPPVTLLDAEDFTQLEVPKIVFIKSLDAFLMLCSTTNRQSECQESSDVDNLLRLYWASDITGPWKPAGTQTSIIAGVDLLFGATILEIDEVSDRLICIAPYTSAADATLALSFAPRFFIDLRDVGTKQQVFAYFD